MAHADDQDQLGRGRCGQLALHHLLGQTRQQFAHAVLAHRHPLEAVPALEDAARALHAIHGRHARLGRWGASGPELTALGVALVMVDEMQLMHPRAELLDALRVVMRVQDRPERVGELIEVAA